MAQRLGSITLAIGIAALSGFGALVGSTWGFGLKCDDSCSTPPPWREDPNAWQWDAFGWIGIGGFVCALVFVIVVVLRRKLVAWVALGSWAVLAIVFLKLFRDSGLTSHAGRGWIALAALFVVGVGAVALTPSRRARAR
jgi:cell division protein FtsW (lipid II flippase)